MTASVMPREVEASLLGSTRGEIPRLRKAPLGMTAMGGVPTCADVGSIGGRQEAVGSRQWRRWASSEGAIGFGRRRKPPERDKPRASPEGAEGALCPAAPSGLGVLLSAIRRLTPPARPLRPFGTAELVREAGWTHYTRHSGSGRSEDDPGRPTRPSIGAVGPNAMNPKGAGGLVPQFHPS